MRFIWSGQFDRKACNIVIASRRVFPAVWQSPSRLAKSQTARRLLPRSAGRNDAYSKGEKNGSHRLSRRAGKGT